MSFIFILVLLFSCSSVLSANDDGLVLLNIKKQLGNPNILSSWVEGFDFCKISPITNPISYVLVRCNVNHRVSSLILNNIDIHAPFPDAICGLSALKFLEIYHISGLHGPIPSCITKLTNLRLISIVETSLSGCVPNFSANNTNLAVINLSKNRLSGEIPPSLSDLPVLVFLNLSSNYLTGTIPPGIVPHYVINFDQFPSLLLSNNRLTGEIPKSYGSVNFYEINVGNNKLNGDASFLFGFQKPTEIIVLANNRFNFDLSHVELPEPISKLDLSHNKIYGKVPWSFANSTELWNLNLSFNRLCGQLPQGGYMQRFNSTVFANNRCLCGYPLPPCFNSAHAPAPVPTPN